jgi:hypothetical protein
MRDDDNDDLYEEIERRALHAMPDEDDDDAPLDLVDALRPATNGGAEAAPPTDLTLGGYIALHQRVPAFEGSDGMPYTVDVEVERRTGEDPEFVAFLIFVRWAATGAGIMDHVESGDVAQGATEDEARQAAYELSLYEVRTELDAAIARRSQQLDDAG